MKLLTEEVKKNLKPLYFYENTEAKDIMVKVKFFHPFSHWTWYVYEFDGVDTFFGFVKGFENELGYFSLSELEATIVHGLHVEIDLYFEPVSLKELMEEK